MPMSAKPGAAFARRVQCPPGVCHSKACRSVGFWGVGVPGSLAALTAGDGVVPLSGATSLSTLRFNQKKIAPRDRGTYTLCERLGSPRTSVPYCAAMKPWLVVCYRDGSKIGIDLKDQVVSRSAYGPGPLIYYVC